MNNGPITDKDLYIDDCSDLEISWVSEVEESLRGSITDKPLTGSLNRSTLSDLDTAEKSDLDTILDCSIDSLDDLKILEYQNVLISDINKSEDIKKCINQLNWIHKSAKKLSDKLKLKMYEHKKGSLIRSSYKFCDYNYQCKFNYNLKKHNGCLFQHFVHNLVCADIKSLLNFIKKETLSDSDKTEIGKSIKTLSFVLAHMYDELNNIQLFNSNKKVDLHVERNPKNDNRKKNKKHRPKKPKQKK